MTSIWEEVMTFADKIGHLALNNDPQYQLEIMFQMLEEQYAEAEETLPSGLDSITTEEMEDRIEASYWAIYFPIDQVTTQEGTYIIKEHLVGDEPGKFSLVVQSELDQIRAMYNEAWQKHLDNTEGT